MTPTCPLTGSIDVVEIASVDPADIARFYRWRERMEVVDELPAEPLRLYRNEAIGFAFFWPLHAGSRAFYDRLTANLPYLAAKPEYDFAAAHLPVGSVLDVGCGHGWFRTHAGARDYLGLELSAPAAAQCRARGIPVVERPLEDLVREGRRFDAVVSFQVLEHVEDPRGLFASLVGATRPGGTLIVSVPNADSFPGASENVYLNMPPHHLTWWTKQSLLWLGAQFDLGLVDCHIDRAATLADFTEIFFKSRLNRLLRCKPALLRPGLADRAANFAFRALGYAVSPGLPPHIMPAGHSITMVWRRPA
jgi:SAM-dependent methyltransferase